MSVHGLPSSTEIKKLVHKKLLYAKFPKELCGERRKQFDDDIGRIVVTNEISPVSVNIKEGEQVKSIFVLQVELKTKAYNERNIVLISKLFGQHLLIVSFLIWRKKKSYLIVELRHYLCSSLMRLLSIVCMTRLVKNC